MVNHIFGQVIGTTLPSNNDLSFEKNLLEEVQRVVVTIDKSEIRNCSMILIEQPEISALSSRKIDKYEHFIGERILPIQQ